MNKTQKKQYFKNILNKGLCDSLKSERPNDFEELITLFSEHPNAIEKRVNDLIDIKIVRNPNNYYYEFNIILSDFTINSISYIQCIDKTQSTNYDLNQAFRTSIRSQTFDFFNQSTKVCVLCGSKNQCQVDHIILFRYLTKDFLTNKDLLTIPKTFDKNDSHQLIFQEKDKQFSDDWFDYHKNNAVLRILCKKCNLSRSKK